MVTKVCERCRVTYQGHGNTRRCWDCSIAHDAELQARRATLRRRMLRTLGERDGWRCYLCDRSVEEHTPAAYRDELPTLDHIRPLCDGGTDDDSNLAVVHWRCNVRKGRRPLPQDSPHLGMMSTVGVML